MVILQIPIFLSLSALLSCLKEHLLGTRRNELLEGIGGPGAEILGSVGDSWSLGLSTSSSFSPGFSCCAYTTLLPALLKPVSSPGCFAGLRTGALWLNWCFLSTGAN